MIEIRKSKRPPPKNAISPAPSGLDSPITIPPVRPARRPCPSERAIEIRHIPPSPVPDALPDAPSAPSTARQPRGHPPASSGHSARHPTHRTRSAPATAAVARRW
ncbi:hypothetical protein C8Q76DRAFT_290339 [Earliella scabrosa]|nr:hypothetical protein C8Q76DRAFT_290339 [Earliella scabrosa]